MSENVSKKELEKILHNHTLAASGMGLVPIFAADIAGVITVQLRMLKEIAALYGVPYRKAAVKKTILSLIGAMFLSNSFPWLASAVKLIPIVGQSLGTMSMPIVCGASTYATGKVFIQHFDSGGTFLTFNPEKVKAYYAEMLKEGKSVAANMTDHETVKNEDERPI